MKKIDFFIIFPLLVFYHKNILTLKNNDLSKLK